MFAMHVVISMIFLGVASGELRTKDFTPVVTTMDIVVMDSTCWVKVGAV